VIFQFLLLLLSSIKFFWGIWSYEKRFI